MRIINDPTKAGTIKKRRRVRKSEKLTQAQQKNEPEKAEKRASIWLDSDTEQMIIALRRYGNRDQVIAKAVKFLYDKDQAAMRITEAVIIS